MAYSECMNCGKEYHWDWIEAFCKFGFGDGDGQVETGTVAGVLEEAGYEVQTTDWGLHNHVISSIKKNGVEYIPDENSGFTFGYDNPRVYLKEEIVDLLDKELPPTTEYMF